MAPGLCFPWTPPNPALSLYLNKLQEVSISSCVCLFTIIIYIMPIGETRATRLNNVIINNNNNNNCYCKHKSHLPMTALCNGNDRKQLQLHRALSLDLKWVYTKCGILFIYFGLNYVRETVRETGET